MTDRIKGFIVTLDHDIRDDDVEGIMAAIRHIRSVTSVKPMVAGFEDHMARDRVRSELQLALNRAVADVLNPKEQA